MTWEKNIINIKIKTISTLYEKSEKLVLGVMTAVQSRVWKISTYRKIGNHTNPILWRFLWLPIHILWNFNDYNFFIFYPKTSCLSPHGWYSWRGYQNLSLLTKLHVFLGFKSFLSSSSEAELRVVVPTPQL